MMQQCISSQAPIEKVKFTRPPSPWMKDPEILSAKANLEKLRSTSRDFNHTTTRDKYVKLRNSYKNLIQSKKGTFIKKNP